MTSTQSRAAVPSPSSEPTALAMRFEVAVLPVSDVDRAKAFYTALGWRLDADLSFDENYRIVQLTPPGSAASIQFGTGLVTSAPGSAQNMYLIVDDIDAARRELTSHGASVTEVYHGKGMGTEGHLPGPDPDGHSYSTFASFADPDGNTWLLQQITERLPGRD